MAKILIVDDSLAQRKSIERDLLALNHETILASNGEEALEVIQEKSPDCVFSDLLMPVMDGTEFLRRLREDNNNVPVIVVTANSNKNKIAEVEEIGVTTVLNKPYDLEELKEALEEALRG